MNVMRFFGVSLSLLICSSTDVIASMSTPIPHGQGAFFYDNGTTGQWIPDITAFNTNNLGFPPIAPGGPVLYPINRFYINVGGLRHQSMQC